MIKVIRDERTGSEIQIFFTAPEDETELNADRSVNRCESDFYTDAPGTDCDYAQNTTAWD